MMLPLVILAHALPDKWISPLENRCKLIVGPAAESSATPGIAPPLLKYLPEAEGLFTLLVDPVDEALLEQAPRLRVVSNMAVGVDNIDLAACTRRSLPVGNTPGVLTEATADLTMALLLSAARRLPDASQDARLGRWITWVPDGWLGFDLNGATLGIIGLGKIGKAVAARARGFGLRLIYYDINPQPEAEEALGLHSSTLDDLLHQSDFICIHTPLTAVTRGLINERTLRMMKPMAILVNTARGPIVDTEALAHALAQGWIAGAALDVSDPEPLPSDHPLYQMPNCLILPHIGSATYGTRQRMAELACQNLLDGLEGRVLTNCANPQVYLAKEGN